MKTIILLFFALCSCCPRQSARTLEATIEQSSSETLVLITQTPEGVKIYRISDSYRFIGYVAVTRSGGAVAITK